MRNHFVGLLLIAFTFGIFETNTASAGCTNACISSDSIGNNTIDTVYGTPFKLWAKYNQSCYILGFDTLIWCRNGIPFDTTTNADAAWDGVWNYRTSLTVNQPGVYTVYPIQFHTPGYECGQITVENSPGATTTVYENNLTENSLSVYPNPSSTSFTIENTKPIQELLITDLSGKIVFSQSGSFYKTSVANLERGSYLLILTDENRKKFSEKIIRY